METVCIPADITAYALSPACCDQPPAGQPALSRLAPITQPNYIGLQLKNSLIQHDVLDHVDFHLTSPAEKNPRLTDLGANPPQLRPNRLGVYIHWSLPRLYRTAVSSADSYVAKDTSGRAQEQNPNPTFRRVPDRWLIIRHLDPATARPKGKLPEYQSWVIESNRLRRIDEIPEDADLETDVSPFVAYTSSNDDPAKAGGVLEDQAEVFIGMRTPHMEVSPGSGVKTSPSGPWTEKPGNFVDLTVMNSSNPLFSDYVPHNSNVFSMIDSFAYKDSPNDVDFKHLEHANADYFVLGWHSKFEDSPLAKSGVGGLESRLSTLLLNLDTGTDKAPDTVAKALADKGDACPVLVHGSVYHVVYDLQSKPRSFADEAAVKFTKDVKMEPLSMGTTALDGIITFLKAHNDDNHKDEEDTFGTGSGKLADDVLQLASLLYAADDSYDERIKAQDLMYTNNFARSDGGSYWSFNGKTEANKPPRTPDDKTEVPLLAKINEKQKQLDTGVQKLADLRWQLFAEWWKFVSDRDANGKEYLRQRYHPAVLQLKTSIQNLDATCKRLKFEINGGLGADGKPVPGLTSQVPCKQSAKPTFFIRRDPTLCIAGIDPGWPKDFMDKLAVKLEHQLKLDDRDKKVQDAAVFLPDSKSFPQNVRMAAQKLIAGYLGRIGTAVDDSVKGHKPWGNVNPFQPLFIEWEAQYYHIDRKKWSVSVRKSPVGQPHDQLRYGIDKDQQLGASDQNDYRSISGRVILTPQPVFSLEAVVRQVIDNAGPDMPLSKQQISDLLDNPDKGIRQLQFISAPLAGLTEHLLTRYEGAHVKPNLRKQGQALKALGPAVDACKAIDVPFDANGRPTGKLMVELIDSESALTPYGNLLNFGDKNYSGVPFKGVTHGQLIFTKLNIIDKFGQAICLPEPKPQPRDKILPPPSFYPCLSDYLSPDLVGKTRLNTVYQEDVPKDGKWPLCRFIQLTPSINQNARINASFLNVNADGKAPFWHETNDDIFESPVFGWLVLNYQDYGLQFFLPDGTFYREVRVGGPTGTNASSKWIPFDPPKDAKNTGNMQLDQLIARMTTAADAKSYLQGFFDMINAATQCMPYPPSEYSAYANAIVGKPLALVNVGWSLELQAPPIKHQNSLGNKPNDEATDLYSYRFPIKLGDAERPFDGVVGYYLPKKAGASADTDWESLFTYFPSSATQATKKLTPQRFPVVSPYYIDPEPFADPKATTTLANAHVAKYTVTTMLIDPYTSLHAYSPILPIKTLRIQPWTIQQAFSRMTAFFRLGPALLSQDVPAYVDKPLMPDGWNTAKAVSATPTTDTQKLAAAQEAQKAAAIRLPISGRKGTWQWLQPYDRPADKTGDPNVDKIDHPNVTKFNAMDVGEEDTRIRRDPAPYTFVEGYLQLAKPLLKADVPI